MVEDKRYYCGVPVREPYHGDSSPVITALRRKETTYNRVRALVLLMGGDLVGEPHSAWVVLPADKKEDRAWFTDMCAMVHWLQVRGVEL